MTPAETNEFRSALAVIDRLCGTVNDASQRDYMARNLRQRTARLTKKPARDRWPLVDDRRKDLRNGVVQP